MSSTMKRTFGGTQWGWIGDRSTPTMLALGNLSPTERRSLREEEKDGCADGAGRTLHGPAPRPRPQINYLLGIGAYGGEIQPTVQEREKHGVFRLLSTLLDVVVRE